VLSCVESMETVDENQVRGVSNHYKGNFGTQELILQTLPQKGAAATAPCFCKRENENGTTVATHGSEHRRSSLGDSKAGKLLLQNVKSVLVSIPVLNCSRKLSYLPH
jgi:hypothetical protein